MFNYPLPMNFNSTINNQIDWLKKDLNALERRIYNLEKLVYNYENHNKSKSSPEKENYTYINNNYSTDNYIL